MRFLISALQWALISGNRKETGNSWQPLATAQTFCPTQAKTAFQRALRWRPGTIRGWQVPIYRGGGPARPGAAAERGGHPGGRWRTQNKRAFLLPGLPER